MADKQKKKQTELIGFIGVGLDNKDGHKRITQTEHFLLMGGSEETHERMQDTAIRFNDTLQRRGKKLKDVPVEEVVEIIHKVHDHSK